MKIEDLKLMVPYKLGECPETFKKVMHVYLRVENGVNKNVYGGCMRRGETFFVAREPVPFEFDNKDFEEHYSGVAVLLISATREAIGYHHIYDHHKRSMFQFVEEVTSNEND